MSEARSVTLYCTKGGADKTYQIHLRPEADGFLVIAYNGRRGGTLTPQPKTTAPVAYEMASKIYEDLLKRKLKEGYTVGEDGSAYQNACESLQQTGVDVQLLLAAEEADATRFINDPNYVAQEKHDGERRPVQRGETEVIGINKKGFAVPLPLSLAEALAALPEQTILDAEQVGDRLYVFDALSIGANDVRALPYDDRRRRYELLLGQLAAIPGVVAVETAVSTEEKRALFLRLLASKKEGIVFKHVGAAYQAGRLESQIKIKFVKSATVQVASVHSSKRSVSVQVFDAAGQCIPMGSVTIPANHAVPLVGAIVEVEYLYAVKSLVQPVYKGLRTDSDVSDCTIAQIKYKAGVNDDETGNCEERLVA